MILVKAVAVNKLGKWKTAAQMVALTILLATRNARYYKNPFVVKTYFRTLSDIFQTQSMIVILFAHNLGEKNTNLGGDCYIK
jgi:CDP-diacylglycerol--glycerol-3-phosphate 3-phosphatidyltransferase